MASIRIRLLELTRQRRVSSYLAESKKAREALDADLADLDGQLFLARKAEQQEPAEPDVLVRMTLGEVRKVYHRAKNPCGKVDPARFKRMKESEAQVYDANVGITLKRCSACWNS
jgi:hypothetical protein